MFRRFANTFAGVCLVGLFVAGNPAAQIQSRADTTKGIRLADPDKMPLGPGGDTDPTRTSSTAQNVEDHPFNVPRPITTEPFNYESLNAGDYDLEALQITSEIRLDGLLSEADWQLAVPAMNFYQFEPAQGAPNHGVMID